MKWIAKTGVMAIAVMAMVGCATGGSGMSDEDQIAAIAMDWEKAILAQDMSLSIDHYADDYEDAESGSKAEYEEWISGIMDQGFLDGAEVDRSDAKITLNSETEATYGPIDLSSDAGGWTIDMYLSKEDGAWKIKSTDVY